LTVGGAGTALVSLASLQQNAVTINPNAQLVLRPGTAHLVHSIGALSMTGSGVLDLGNHDLLVGGSTAVAMQAKVAQAANLANVTPNTGYYFFNGVGGINSAPVRADAALNGPQKLGIGIADSNDIAINWAGNPVDGTIPAGKTVVAFTVIGDANLD